MAKPDAHTLKPDVTPGDDSDRRAFIARMKKRLEEKKLPFRHQGELGQPSADDLKAYFGTFTGDADTAQSNLEDYFKWFYIHVDHFELMRPAQEWGGSTEDERMSTLPTWELLGGRTVAIERGCRVVDCKSFSFMARELLTVAGWSCRGFHVFYFVKREQQGAGWPWHIAVCMGFAASGIGNAGVRVIGHQTCSHASPGVEAEAYKKLSLTHFNDVNFTPLLATPLLAYTTAKALRKAALQEEESKGKKEEGTSSKASSPRFNSRTGGAYPPRRPASSFV